MFKTLFCRWYNRYQFKISNQQTFHALSVLDDRLLKDIGLTRADLLVIKYGALPDKDCIEDEPRPLRECGGTFQRLQAIGGQNV